MARKNRHLYNVEKVGTGENRRKGTEVEREQVEWQPGVKLEQRSD